MKFIGEPGLLVRVRSRTRKRPMLIRFDENGFYETENERLIRRLSAKFETAGNQSKEASRTEAAPAIDTPLEFVCQKCGRKCKSAFGLASHEKACKG